jgi:tetratricopeptide (TPR) repeat protein
MKMDKSKPVSSTCLVLMPFQHQDGDIYREEIVPAISSVSLQSVRLDQLTSTDVLISSIWQAINSARIIIADLTGKNPNVFYELGLAHALGKPTLILSESLDDVPFDIRHLRIIRYEPSGRIPGALRRRISDALREMISREQDFVLFTEDKGIDTERPPESQHMLARAAVSDAENALQQGRASEAVDLFKRATELYAECKDDRGLATALNNLGSAYQEIGDYSSALASLQQSVELLKRIGDPRGEAAAYGNLASVFETRGDFERAEEFFRRALELSFKLNDKSSYAYHQSNLASLMVRKGDLDAAERYYEEALRTFDRLGNAQANSTTLANLGLLRNSQGRSEEARVLLEQSLEGFQKLGMLSQVSRVLHNLASLMQDRGELDTAEKYLKESLQMKEKLGDRAGEAASLANLGTIAATRGELDEALSLYTKSATIYQETGNFYAFAQTLVATSRVLAVGGHPDQAQELLEHVEQFGRDVSPAQHEFIAKLLADIRAASDKKGSP